MASGNNIALRLWLGIVLLLLTATVSFARDIRHVEFVRYGQNNPDSPLKPILSEAQWIAPVAPPGFYELPSGADISFVTRSTLYVDQETIALLAPELSGDFGTLVRQDMSRVAEHPGINGAPLLVCFYGPDSRDWGRPQYIPSEVPLETVHDHAGEIRVNLYWHVIDHPPYHDILNHPLSRIGPFRAICPGEASSPLVRQFARFVRGTIEYVVKWGFEFNAPIRSFGQAPPSIPMVIGSEYRVAIEKERPRISTALGARSGPLSDPPPMFLRFNVTSVTYDQPGPTGLVEMDFVPLQFALTQRFSGLPESMAAQVGPGDVAAARERNPQQMYHLCTYRQGKAAYWVWSDPFALSAQGVQVRPAKGSPERPVFACPLDPGRLWR